MKVLSSREMREIDRKAIEEIGIIGPILMENAGLRVFEEIKKRYPDLKKKKIVIVAGKGNNGGDGLVVARHLSNSGCEVEVLLLASKNEIKGDAALNLRIAEKMGIKIAEIKSSFQLKNHKQKIFRADIVVDAIFGTGLSMAVGGLYEEAIREINTSSAYKVAIDIPSGLSADTFQVIGPCLKADLTVTLAAPKIAHIFPPAEDFMGELVVGDIGIPPFLLEDEKLKLELVEKKKILPYFAKRKKDTHKGSYGHLLIISGSLGKTGAAIMAGKAALKMGAGLVTVGTPASCLPIVAKSMMELMTEPLAETEEGTLAKEARAKILELLEGKNALMIGPGISTHPSTQELVLSLVSEIKIPSVLDADALNILSRKPSLLRNLPQPSVLTPHPGEFARLLNVPTKEVLDKRLEVLPKFAEDYGLYVVLKGYRTLTATPEGKVYINPTGNPGMATAGSGDVLSGMIASMIMQGGDFLESVLAAVYIHGLSGDLAAERIGEKPLTAGNIITFLPSAIKSLSLNG